MIHALLLRRIYGSGPSQSGRTLLDKLYAATGFPTVLVNTTVLTSNTVDPLPTIPVGDLPVLETTHIPHDHPTVKHDIQVRSSTLATIRVRIP